MRRASSRSRAALPAVSSRSPFGAATTTRSAAPFWAPNFAVDQVGRLLRVRAGDLEVVDQLAVERGVQADQQDEHRQPAEDDAARMPRARAGDGGERAGRGDPAILLQQLRVLALLRFAHVLHPRQREPAEVIGTESSPLGGLVRAECGDLRPRYEECAFSNRGGLRRRPRRERSCVHPCAGASRLRGRRGRRRRRRFLRPRPGAAAMRRGRGRRRGPQR